MHKISKLSFYMFIIYTSLLLACGGGDGSGSEKDVNGTWNVSVSLAANGCPNDAKITQELDYVHQIHKGFSISGASVAIIDNNSDLFSADDATEITSNSFIATGTAHSLNPFINDYNCTETIIWSYFDITDSATGTFSNNVGRNSLIDCVGGGEPIHCNVNYIGSAFKQ